MRAERRLGLQDGPKTPSLETTGEEPADNSVLARLRLSIRFPCTRLDVVYEGRTERSRGRRSAPPCSSWGAGRGTGAPAHRAGGSKGPRALAVALRTRPGAVGP